MNQDIDYLPRGSTVHEYARLALAARLAGLAVRRALRDHLLGLLARTTR